MSQRLVMMLCTLTVASAFKLSSLPVARRQHNAASLTRLRMVVMVMEPPQEGVFQDYERECFGDEDGCDLYYYGETPEDVKNRLLEKERPAGLM